MAQCPPSPKYAPVATTVLGLLALSLWDIRYIFKQPKIIIAEVVNFDGQCFFYLYTGFYFRLNLLLLICY